MKSMKNMRNKKNKLSITLTAMLGLSGMGFAANMGNMAHMAPVTHVTPGEVIGSPQVSSIITVPTRPLNHYNLHFFKRIHREGGGGQIDIQPKV